MGFSRFARKDWTMKPKIVGCDSCGELKPSTGGSKQVGNGQFMKIFLCDDCKPIVSRITKNMQGSNRSRKQYLADIKK